jgi:2-(1,2-epoxy-1,2-dihydrophenyl)acetyl-CoA isomerase
MTDPQLVRLEIDDGVADLVLASPDTGNVLSKELAVQLRAAAESLADNDEVRVVVLSAEGKAFCVGGDLGFMAGAGDRLSALRGLADDAHAAQLALLDLPAPLVVRVQGVAAGIGMSFVACADIAIAGRSAAFVSAYSGVGLSPDGGQSWLLPRLVGLRRATELILTNRKLGADEALAIGLLTEVVDDDALEERTAEVAARLAKGPTVSFGAIRRLIREGATTPFAEHLDAEAHSISTLAASPTGREGVDAFLAKRRPDFPAR